MMLVLSASVTRSTGTTGGDSSVMSSLCCQLNRVAATIAACSSTATMIPPRPSRAVVGVRSMLVGLRLCDIGNQADMREPCGGKKAHDLHHPAVIDRTVAAHENALVVTVGRDGDELGNQRVFLDRLVLQK